MKFKYRNKISFTHILLNLVVLTGFFYVLINVDRFQTYAVPSVVQAYQDHITVLKQEDYDDTVINPNNIFIDDNLDGLITYVVQPGDNLSKIAVSFGVTVQHIKRINNIKNDIIKPGQILKITEDDGFLYESKGETISQLANKFKIKKEDILQANGLDDVNYKFDKGDEVFIPISNEKYKKLFHKDIVKKIKTKPVIKPVAKPKSIKKIVKKTVHNIKRSTTAYKGRNIVAKYRYRPNISNGFYRGHCTRYVAIKKFPYIGKNRQKKLWNGNAKYWYEHAKAKGYPVGHIPKVGSIVVIKIGGRRYHYAGHVAIVRQIDRKHRRILVEEMNALGKYVVTKRWIPMDWKIIGYIYI